MVKEQLSENIDMFEEGENSDNQVRTDITKLHIEWLEKIRVFTLFSSESELTGY